MLSYGPRVIMAENLQQGLDQLLGGSATIVTEAPRPGEGVTIARPGQPSLEVPVEQASRALRLYREAQDHLRNGEWAQYGQKMQELEQLLVELERRLRGGGGG